MRILLGTRNGAAHLPAQLASYLEQTHTDWSLWASDDGSTDATPDILAAFRAAHPARDIHLLKGPRRGTAAGNFLHLLHHPDLPPGPVTLSDQDDVWLPHRISDAVAALAGQTGPAATIAPIIHTTPDLTPLRPARPLPRPDFRNALVQNIATGHTITLNAAALAALRADPLPDPLPPFHDWWLYLRLTAANIPLIPLTKPAVLYRQHDSQVLGTNHPRLARTRRLGLILDGTYGRWISANIAALETVSSPLPADHIAAARALAQTRPRWRALRASGAFRTDRFSHAVMWMAALAGRL